MYNTNMVGKRLARVVVIVPLLTVLGSGCATIISDNRVPVTSTPPGAKVFVDSVDHGRTPVKLDLPKNLTPSSILITLKGYHPYKDNVDPLVVSANPWLYLNILFFPGFIVDMLSDAYYIRRPNAVHVDLISKTDQYPTSKREALETLSRIMTKKKESLFGDEMNISNVDVDLYGVIIHKTFDKGISREIDRDLPAPPGHVWLVTRYTPDVPYVQRIPFTEVKSLVTVWESSTILKFKVEMKGGRTPYIFQVSREHANEVIKAFRTLCSALSFDGNTGESL